MIELIPAIDIINGSCVRLVEGDFSRKTDYLHDPVEMAVFFEEAGFKRLHVVDLDGARSGKPVHVPLLRQMVDEARLKIDFGGGVRETEQVRQILESGAVKVSLGSIAVSDPDKVIGWIDEFGPDSFFFGADIKDGKIATHGWTSSSDYDIYSFIEFWAGKGIKNFFCTDVSRDGKLQGPATDLYIGLKSKFPDIYLAASGGVACAGDISELDEAGIDGVIFGKAFYEKRISIWELAKWL